MSLRLPVVAISLALGCASDGAATGATTTGQADTEAGSTGGAPPTSTSAGTGDASGADDTSTSEGDDTTGGEPDDPPPPAPAACVAAVSEQVDPGELPEDYGWTTEPPQMALGDSF